MTRFARAKGSKASNERTPEDSTPWEVMKEQLIKSKKETEYAKKREEAEKQRIENYENFLKEQKVQKSKATWCDFPESQSNNNISNNKETPKKKKKEEIGSSSKTETDFNVGDSNVERKKSKKNKNPKVSVNAISNTEDNIIQPLKKKKNKGNATDSQLEASDSGNVTENSKKLKKKKKGKFNNDIQNLESNNDTITKQINNSETKKNKQIQEKEHNNVNNNEGHKQQQKLKKNKFANGQPVRRKPINDKSFQLIINGKEVELVRFDGFPIMKRDAERLEELKSSMVKKGIPKSEVQRTLKLERRRAEKALARLKRDVCYNCRKGGHNLSDCPDLKSKIPGVGAADGMCFKCGSTEHRQFECKVQKDKEFRFATCFICKEPGHIARQCPDNPKGLYPNGGSCKLCGDVTHLRKDCPTVNEKKEGSSIKLQTLDSTDTLEGIEQNIQNTSTVGTQKKPKKIKF